MLFVRAVMELALNNYYEHRPWFNFHARHAIVASFEYTASWQSLLRGGLENAMQLREGVLSFLDTL